MRKKILGEGGHLSKITCNISLVITIIGLLILITGTSYAALIGNTSSSSEQIIRAGGVTLTLTENYESINKKIIVLEDADGLLQEDVYEFNIKNTGSIAARYDIKIINELSGENVLPLEYIKVGLEINGEEYGPFNLGEEEGIIDSGVIYEKEIINYSLRVWLDKEYEESIEEIEGKMANLKIVVEAEQRPNSMDKGESKEFSYTGDVEEYIVPRDGWYYIELGGAQGGSAKYTTLYEGGLGSKTSGYIELEAGDKLYFYVGGMGSSHSGTSTDTMTPNGKGYNGGSVGRFYANNSNGGGGGGATDVRLVGGTWDNTTSLISRIMVAAGGGGGDSHVSSPNYSGDGGDGGTLYGIDSKKINDICYTYGKGGTQTSGGVSIACSSEHNTVISGAFGIGGNMSHATGGGGYYGGAGGGHTSAAGGSSYISGYAGVNSVEESTTITHTNQTLHYSGKYFIGGSMIAGANSGDGYAKIVYVDTKPKRKNTDLNNVRYIKNCINGDSVNSHNAWVEVQAIVDGVNIAKGKTGNVYNASGSIVTSLGTNYAYSYATDGIIDNVEGSKGYAMGSTYTGLQCFVVDLGNTYDLDEVGVWHYANDSRTYYDDATYVSSNNNLWKEVIDETRYEDHGGKRTNAYTDTYNGYVQDSLVLWYDGYANTGKARDNTTTTWKDLSGNNNDGTLNGGVWNYNYLSFDGVDDTVSTNMYLADALPSNSDRTLSITLKINSVPYTNTTYGNTGILFGGAYYGGMGIAWYRDTSSESFTLDGFTRASGETYNIFGTFNYPTNVLNLTYVNNPSNNKAFIYLNGVKVKESSSTTGSYTYASTIGNIGINKAQIYGGNYATSYANMDVYSAKIYNKALTDEEVLHNYLYEKQTFNLE